MAQPWDLPRPDFHADFYRDVPMKRLVAFLVDSLAIGLVTLVLVPFTAFTALFYLPLLALAVSFVYRTLTIAAGSATWGMRLCAIELRNHRGERLDLATDAAHTALFLLILSTVLPLLISAALMLGSPRRQGLHDMVLGTAAVNRAARA
jgi:uncharacterized RDD family membrane protein YckC